MNDDILDAQAHVNPDNWDSKTRIKISDAIIEVNDHLKKVKFGRYLLFFLVVFLFVPSLLIVLTSSQYSRELIYATLLGLGTVALPFLIFGVFYPKNPLLFLILGLSVYLLFQLISALALGQSLLQGYGWKIAILAGFGFAIFSALRWKGNLEKLRELGYPTSRVTEARKQLKPIPRLRKKKKT